MAKLSASCVHANFSLLLGDLLFENVLSVQVSIEILKKVLAILLFENNSVKV